MPTLYRSPGHRALRKGRCSLPGQIYLVTVVCQHRRRRFNQFESACAVSRVLGDQHAWSEAQALAWVLMPDHWHALVQLGGRLPLAAVVQRINSISARAANRAVGEQGQVWQGAYHDHALRADEDVRAAARYLIANPIRAGLVARVHDYPYWDANWLSASDSPFPS